MNEITLKPSYWASVSGGKDSMYMLYLILNNPDKYPLDGVVHFELETDYPFIRNVIDKLEIELKPRGIKMLRIKPSTSWKELYNKYGYPTGKVRWCNGQYKLDARRQLEKMLKENNCYCMHYIGYCADEKNRFEKRKNGKITEIYPLADFEIYEETILQWAKNEPMFNDFYKYNKRCGCMGCPLSSRIELAYFRKYYPVLFYEYMTLAIKTENEHNISVWQGNRKYNTKYVIKNVENKYLPKLNEVIKNGKNL